MANAATTKTLQFPGFTLIEVEVTWDTVETFSIAHGGPADVEPLYVIHSLKTHGTDAVTFASVMDLPNDDFDVTILLENAGTLGTPVSKHLLFFPAGAGQDGQSINQENNS